MFEAVLHRNSVYKITVHTTSSADFLLKLLSTFDGIGEATRERGCFKGFKIQIARD